MRSFQACNGVLLLALGLVARGSSPSYSGSNYDTSNSTGLANSQILNDPFPYYFPRQDASPARLFAMSRCQGVDIEEASIDELQKYLASGELTSVQLVTCYIQRHLQTAQYLK